MEYLHAVVARVGDEYNAVARHGDALRRQELPLARAMRAEREYGGAVDAKCLDAVVAGVGDDYYMIAGDGNAPRRREVSLARAMRAEHEGGGAVGIDDLDAVVASVGDGEHVARRQEGDRVGAVKLPRLAAARPKLADECAVGAEHLDAVVASVGDGDRAVGADGDAPRRREVSLARAMRAEHEGGGAVGAEHLDAVVASVGDGEHAVPKHARRAVGRRPAGFGMRCAASNGGGRGQQACDGDGAEQGEP